MKKRLISTTLILIMLLTATLPALGAMSLSNFETIRTYNNEFTDITAEDWYYDSILGAYERGIMGGKGDGIFDPLGRLTIAETIKLAACLHKCYHTGTMEFEEGTPWYAPYVEYAAANGIPAGAYRNYNAAATRADFALIIAGAMPLEAITPMNRIAEGAIPDVSESYSYGPAVYKLYRAGILTGMDGEGSFYPGRTLTRAEAATIIMRVVDADSRQPLALAAELTAEQIYKLASPAVFFVEIFDEEGELIKTGSGFFISETGLAVTNYHVVIGSVSAKITTDDGEVYDVLGIYDYNWKDDISLIQVDATGYPYLEIADPTKLQTGATVYTLGSPLGLQASFSRGIVSQSLREINGVEYIQLDAPISSGSSGGALLDAYGRVVGVTSATAVGAQNINLAMPINLIDKLSREEYAPLASILIETAYYQGYYPAPDFGEFFGVMLFNTGTSRGGTTYSYRLADIPDEVDDVIDDYRHLLEQNMFIHTSYLTSNGIEFLVYYNSANFVTVIIGKETIRRTECFSVTVY